MKNIFALVLTVLFPGYNINTLTTKRGNTIMPDYTLSEIDVLATIFCYDVVIDGDKKEAKIFLDGMELYAVRLV